MTERKTPSDLSFIRSCLWLIKREVERNIYLSDKSEALFYTQLITINDNDAEIYLTFHR